MWLLIVLNDPERQAMQVAHGTAYGMLMMSAPIAVVPVGPPAGVRRRRPRA